MDFLSGWIAPLVIALVPAAYRLWRGRALSRRLDDPALPERLLGERQPQGFVVALALTFLIAIWYDRLFLTVPVLLLASAAAAYPLRKALYEETWSLTVYLWFLTRLATAIWGFWLLLFMAPLATNRSGWQGWAAAVIMLVLLLSWDARFPDIVRAALRARPLDRPGLVPRFAALVERSAVGAPRFDEAPVHGGLVANAVALPSLRRPGVLFTDALLDRLSVDESTAICAHELAHLEYFNAARLRRMRVAAIAFMAAGTMLPPLSRALGLQLPAFAVMAVWAVALVTYLAVLGRRRQKNETASDLRAIELGGDPEALISSLEKLHALARLPRRWDRQMERHATHPSLARRVQDIRAAAGAPPPAPGEAATFAAAEGPPASVTFHADRLQWTEGDAAFTLPYASLSDLRVDIGRSDVTRLVAADEKGRRWLMVVKPGDVARLQRVLDVADARPRSAATAPADVQVARLVAALAAVVALFAGQPGGLVAGLASLESAYPLAAAAGTAALLAGGLAWRDGAARVVGADAAWPMVVLLLCAAFLFSFAWRTRRSAVPPNAGRLSAASGVIALLWLIPLAFRSVDLIGFHMAARSLAGFAILALAFAVAWAAQASRSARPLAALSAAAGLAVLLGGSEAFVDLAVRDPLLPPAPLSRELRPAGPAEADFTLAVMPISIRLSPSGRSLAVVESVDDDVRQFHVARAGGPLRGIEADDVLFVNDDHLIAAFDDDGATVVRRIEVDSPAVAWEQRLPRVDHTKLSLNAAGTQWRVLGYEPGRGRVNVEGDIERGGVVRESRWADDDASVFAAAASGDRLLLSEDVYQPYGSSSHFIGWVLGGSRSSTRLRMETPSGATTLAASALDATCQPRAYGDGAVCTVFDGSRTHVLAVDLPSGAIRAVARVPGRFFMSGDGRGWVSGVVSSAGLAAVQLDTGAVLTLPRAPGTFGNIVSGMDDRIITVSADPEEVRVRIMRVAGR